MRFFIIVSAVLVGYVSAQAQCFDAGDCILSGGGQCVKDANQLLGLDPSKAPILQVFSAMEFKYYEIEECFGNSRAFDFARFGGMVASRPSGSTSAGRMCYAADTWEGSMCR
ncbi:hypothetical protein MCOR07_005418 [Pyricularia oryzae]|nr:hypothetical protein MCOR26_008861 [Pyricularia oryzae]KAI6349191.1 hypothetical protein MCOR28_001280 [Pyricularia oryzae]KAI6620555.1 hypothetical protein MCOR07_005418 [Pyricularia oryzae]